MWSRTLAPGAASRVGAFPVFILEVPEGRFYGFPEARRPGLKSWGSSTTAARSSTRTTRGRRVIEPEDEARAARPARAATSPTATGRPWR